MNVQVDLILPEEHRNASAFNLPALLRILSIIGPAIIFVLIILLVINFSATKSDLNNLETQWKTIETQKNMADKAKNQINANKETLKNLNGIKHSRLEWNKQLLLFMTTTPDSIQLRKLSGSGTLQLNAKKQVTRTYNVSLSGKAIGDKIDITIANFTKTLSTGKKFSPYIERAQVTDYDKDHSLGAKINDRVFTIDCSYKPRKFE